MNILQITPQIPFPLHDGGKIGIYNITKHLSLLGHNVTLMTFVPSAGVATDEVWKYAQLEVVVHENKNSILDALRSLRVSVPYTVSKYHVDSMEHRLVRLFDVHSFDLVHVDHIHMAHYGVLAKEKFHIPIFLREHNFDTAIWEKFSQTVKNPFVKWYVQIQFEKMRVYETEMAERFDCCLMMSKEDEAKLRRVSEKVKTAVVRAGVDTSFHHPIPTVPEEPLSILFLGSLDWLPNQDGFWWFYRSILPKIIERFPSVKLYLVGKSPPRKLRHISHPNVIVVGYVDDIRPYVQRSAVCIVPLRIGSGMRIKILEMLSMKKAIVSTSTGCEGIELQDGRELLVADDEETFAEKVCTLLSSEFLRRSLGEMGRSLVEEKYQWRNIVQRLVSVYETTLHKKLTLTGT